MPNYTLTHIFIYPVKSLGGIKLNSAQVTARGLKYDRQWMIVDEHGNFLTQRRKPSMALIDTSLSEKFLTLKYRYQDITPLRVGVNESTGEKIKVKIFDEILPAYLVSEEADEWLSDALGMKCRLVVMTDEIKRYVDKKYARKNETVGFADGFPFLILGQASLDLLNSKLENKLNIDRFRPNFVFSGGEPHDEDKWNKIKIGDIKFSVVKPCARCVITTINQKTGERGKEPLLTLSGYRKTGAKIYFGQNMLAENSGVISIEDKIEILEFKE